MRHQQQQKCKIPTLMRWTSARFSTFIGNRSVPSTYLLHIFILFVHKERRIKKKEKRKIMEKNRKSHGCNECGYTKRLYFILSSIIHGSDGVP